MKSTLISYDLIAPNRDYSRLIEAIKSLSPQNWAKPLESLWLVPTTLTCAQVRDRLTPVMDANDKLFVTQAGPDWAGRNLADEVAKWLKRNLS
ncbi:hypothetical protein BH11VER1_BH11VER1_06650 [soil metagenome]